MDESKLYNALLKSEQERREGSSSDGEARAEDQFRTERPFAGSRAKSSEWDGIVNELSDTPPTLYDASVTLGRIENPCPWTDAQLRARKILYPEMPNKEIMNAYRELRITLRNKATDQQSTIMLSSLGRDTSSVLTAFNLAASYSMDAQTSALLIDCDPYDAQLAELVSTTMAFGVTDFLADKSLTVKHILYPSGVDRLSVIPAGTHASSAVELFSGSRMSELMHELRSRYPDRCIVINAPPFRDSTEARILCRYADQVVLGVPFGEVNAEEIMDCVEALDSEKFAGLIFQE